MWGEIPMSQRPEGEGQNRENVAKTFYLQYNGLGNEKNKHGWRHIRINDINK